MTCQRCGVADDGISSVHDFQITLQHAVFSHRVISANKDRTRMCIRCIDELEDIIKQFITQNTDE